MRSPLGRTPVPLSAGITGIRLFSRGSAKGVKDFRWVHSVPVMDLPTSEAVANVISYVLLLCRLLRSRFQRLVHFFKATPRIGI